MTTESSPLILPDDDRVIAFAKICSSAKITVREALSTALAAIIIEEGPQECVRIALAVLSEADPEMRAALARTEALAAWEPEGGPS